MLSRCLYIPEIQISICEDLGKDKAGQKSLVDLSLTNKRFQRPALNELWKTQTSLIPLFKCFPSDSWSIRLAEAIPSMFPVQVEKQSMVFTRYIAQKDWNRVSFYARRIHSLDICMEEFDAFSTDFWQILSASLPTTMDCLLPELRELRYPDTDIAFHAFRLVMSRRLHDLTLSLNGSPLRLTAFQSLPQLSPGLKTLVIRGYRIGNIQGLSPALVKLKAIRNLTIESVTRKPMHWITAHLPAIETLDLRFSLLEGKDFRQKPLRRGIFPKLHKATFRNLKMCLVPQVVTPIGSNVLTQIKLHEMRGGNEENWAQIFVVLLQFGDSLECVEIMERPTPLGSNTVLTQLTFEDILALSRLKTLRIQTKSQVSLTDDFLRRLGESCKDLRVLEIEGSPVDPDAAPSLRGLHPLLEYCQDLKHLYLYINASRNPYEGTPSPSYVRANKSLTSLHVGNSPINNTVDVAAFLGAVTPSLEILQWSHRPEEPLHGTMWQQTDLHLQVVRKLRSAYLVPS